MIYRKSGTVVRWEHDTVVTVRESGEAREIGGEFVAEPSAVILSDGEGSQPSRDEILRYAQDDVRRLAVNVERLLVTEGVADHECGPHRWRERARRVHLSMTNGKYRALVDLAEFASVIDIATALARIAGERKIGRLRLAPNVAATLLPSLIGLIDLEQMPAEHDGYGEPIARIRVSDRTPPNVYRPSYRIRPVRAWHNLRAIPFGEMEDAPRAIALLAPPEQRQLRVLCVDGESAFAAEVNVREIRAVGESENWYPYAAGAFGAEMML